MALYHYRATTDQGQLRQGRLEALHEPDLQSQLKRMGLELLRARVLAPHQRFVRLLPRREVISLLFQLEMLVRAGVPILWALHDLREAAESPAGRDLAAGLHEKIEGGATLGDAVAAYPGVFSATVSHLIRCGEVTGQMPEVLQEIVRSLKWQDELSAQTRKLLLYPAFVTLVVTAVFIFLMLKLVPQLVAFLTGLGQQIPLQTQLLIGLSQLLQQFGWATLLAASALLLVTVSLAASFDGVRLLVHRGQLALPLVGPVLKKIGLARFADTLAMMYRAGIPLTDALTYCQQVSGNLVLQRAIRQARERVINGAGLSDGFAAEMLFPPLVVRMLRVGESTGALDTALTNISYFYRRDIDQSVGRVQALMEPMLTLLLGLLLGWIMLAVLGPIYDSLAVMRT